MAHRNRFARSLALLLFSTLGAVCSAPCFAATSGTDLATVTWTTPSQTIGTTSNLTLSVTIASGTAGVTTTPTGYINFYDTTNSVAVGTATISNGTASATVAAGTLAAGPHQIEALYSGDTLFAPLTSATIAITVETSVTVVLTSNLTTASPQQSILLTATVTPVVVAAGEKNPTGTVLFYAGSTLIGSGTLSASVGNASVATMASSSLPAAIDSVTAVYQGDSYYVMATSNALSVDIQDFTITPAATNPATNLNIVQGATATAGFVITGLGGYNSVVQLVCAVPAQDDMTCTATPQQITPPGTATFAIATFTSGATASNSRSRESLWPRAVGGTALAFLGLIILPFGKRARYFVRCSAGEKGRRFLVLLLLLAGLGGIGVGCTSTNAISSPGTPLGVATLTITASAYVDNAVVSHSAYLTVNVVTAGSTTP